MVTVVFCDLVGSTALSGVLDPETLRSVTLRYFDLMRQQIESHGGTLEKFIGDAVMAVFGVPVTHEDDARRALSAALGMLDALAGLNTDLHAALGIRLNVRIGVNTGSVVAGSDASARQALISGETVNVAARLEQNAAAGQILVGPATVLAAGPTVRTRQLGPLLLKGKSEPVIGYQLLGLGGDDPELLRRFDVSFVGRHHELAALDAAFDRAARDRRARRVTLLGDAGMGKTRLVREWLDRLGNAAASWGTGRCRPYGDHGSLSPISDAVRQLLAADPWRARTPACDGAADPGTLGGPPAGARTAEALDVLSDGLLRDGTPNPSLEDTGAALAHLLAALSASRPVVLVIDDCQWAGDPLLDLLDRLVGKLEQAAVLIVCLSRPELLDNRPDRCRYRPAGQLLMLGGLSPDEAAALAVELCEVSAHWDTGLQRLLERAEGNPLHLEHLLAAVSETGAADELPPTLQALLGARIDALDRTERIALDLASVVGREFAAEELAELSRSGPEGAPDGLAHHGGIPGSPGADGGETHAGDRLGAVLRRLGRRRLIEHTHHPGSGPELFRFTSGLIQEVTYERMSKRTRSERHAHCAELRSVRERGDAAAGGHLELAYRYRAELGLRGERTEGLRLAAALTLARGGARALARSDLTWADDLLGRAARLYSPDEPAWTSVARRLADVRLALGRTREGRALLHEVLRAPADPVEAAHARLALAVADSALGAGAAARAARAALPVFEAAQDDLGQARACIRTAQEHQLHGRHGEANRLLTRALAHAVGADAEPERAAALGAIGVSLWRGPEPVSGAVARCRSLLAEHGGERRTVRATLNCPLAVLLALQEQWSEARACLAEATRLTAELGYAEADVFLPVFAAEVESLAGRPQQSRRLLDGAAQAGLRLGDSGLARTILLDTVRIMVDRGEWGTASHRLDTIGQGPDPARADAVAMGGLRARIAAGQGRPDEAVALAAAAVDTAALTDSPIVRALAALDQAHTFGLLGRWDEAVSAAADAERRFRQKEHLPGTRWALELVSRASRAGSVGTALDAPERAPSRSGPADAVEE
uniref:adenylate/guanylate cyclase domain-containing protein n=1 Tax=Wenjunlia tyrosinilytica TaxID=1544741 RepID=UPI001E64D9BB|nr:adenylate/guanylate cyclase domain-containing protein [Wenjunlia tyrosinilytica]